MKTTVHLAETRGTANHGWLKAAHSFSFADYYDPERMGFGLLRVLNDDVIDASMGFDTHPHKNMEIVSIPLRGALRHKDSQGNEGVIQHGEVQLMSAGRGIFHSEFNDSTEEKVNLLQIWVMPEEIGITPRYDQKRFDPEGRKNQFQTVVSPIGTTEENVKINQQAYFSLAEMDSGLELKYKLRNPDSGIYVFNIDGEISLAGQNLKKRDAIGIEEASEVSINAKSDSSVLVIEVPMS